MDDSRSLDAEERRAITALLFDARLPNRAQALHLELDDQGLEDLKATVYETTERLRDAGLAAKHRAAQRDSVPGPTTTVAIGLRHT